MLKKVLAQLDKAAKDAVLDRFESADDDSLQIDRKQLKKVCQTLKNDKELDFKLLVDLTCVDYLGDEERFEIIYQLYSLTKNYRLRLKVRIPEGEEADTVSDVWRVANVLEREVWDMFGVVFKNHPDLRRLLMYPEFEGHPLRKDYPLKKHQPIIPLLHPIITEDDPPYNWTEQQRKRKLNLEN